MVWAGKSVLDERHVCCTHIHTLYIYIYINEKRLSYESDATWERYIYIYIYICRERVSCSEIRCVCMHGNGGVNVKSHPRLVYAKVQRAPALYSATQNNSGRVFLFLLLLFFFFLAPPSNYGFGRYFLKPFLLNHQLSR